MTATDGAAQSPESILPAGDLRLVPFRVVAANGDRGAEGVVGAVGAKLAAAAVASCAGECTGSKFDLRGGLASQNPNRVSGYTGLDGSRHQLYWRRGLVAGAGSWVGLDEGYLVVNEHDPEAPITELNVCGAAMLSRILPGMLERHDAVKGWRWAGILGRNVFVHAWLTPEVDTAPHLAGVYGALGSRALHLDGKGFLCADVPPPELKDVPKEERYTQRVGCWTLEGPDSYALAPVSEGLGAVQGARLATDTGRYRYLEVSNSTPEVYARLLVVERHAHSL